MTQAWESCTLCSQIPDPAYSFDFIREDEQDDGVPDAIMELIGDESLSSGYKTWPVTCPHCKTRYLAEVDVEPFVWDFTFERERSDGTAMTQFGERYEFPKR